MNCHNVDTSQEREVVKRSELEKSSDASQQEGQWFES